MCVPMIQTIWSIQYKRLELSGLTRLDAKALVLDLTRTFRLILG